MKRRKDEPDGLTPREWQVLALIREGLTNEEIAERLGISFGTAKYHVAEIISKLNADDRHDAVRKGDEKRSAKALLPWLPLWSRLKWFGTAAAIALVVAVGVVLVWEGRSGGSEGGATMPDESAGLDISSQTLAAVEAARATTEFRRTLLLSRGEPQNVGTQSELIASLPRVSTLAELQAVLSDDIAVIVVDASAESEIADTDFLYEQRHAGRSIVGLNLCLIDIPESQLEAETAPPQGGVVTEIAPDGTVRYFNTVDPPDESGRCKWAYDIAQAGYPYMSYVPRQLALEEVETLRSSGINQFMGRGAGRLDIPDDRSCLVRGTLAHLENPLLHPFQPKDCE